ncbi:MAG: glucokinase [Simkaniaceae bacterium]|nr:glucokinase [Simkaniaceae bacterium]
MMYLAGDIGGTKTHLALYEEGGKLVRDQKFASQNYSNLTSIIEEFQPQGVEKGCFGIAGPIKNNQCVATNLPWIVDAQKLPFKKVKLLNDLEANAYGIFELKEDEFFILNQGDSQAEGNKALISAGTGLGEAGLYFDGKKHHPFPCEGGHCDFAPRNELEISLLKYLLKKFGHASYERLLSGPGLLNIYDFLVEVQGMKKDSERDPKLISEKALKGDGETSLKALQFFIDLYGAEAGNTALKFLSLGGIYIGGGIAPKILPLLKEGSFMQSFCAKGRFQKLMEGISVKVILNDNTALLGAMHYAKNYLGV